MHPPLLPAVAAAAVMAAASSMASSATATAAAARFNLAARHGLMQKPVFRHPKNRRPARHISDGRGRLFPLLGTPVE